MLLRATQRPLGPRLDDPSITRQNTDPRPGTARQYRNAGLLGICRRWQTGWRGPYVDGYADAQRPQGIQGWRPLSRRGRVHVGTHGQRGEDDHDGVRMVLAADGYDIVFDHTVSHQEPLLALDVSL